MKVPVSAPVHLNTKEREREGDLAETLAVRSPSLPAGPLLPDAGMSPDLSETQVSASERAWGGKDHATC